MALSSFSIVQRRHVLSEFMPRVISLSLTFLYSRRNSENRQWTCVYTEKYSVTGGNQAVLFNTTRAAGRQDRNKRSTCLCCNWNSEDHISSHMITLDDQECVHVCLNDDLPANYTIYIPHASMIDLLAETVHFRTMDTKWVRVRYNLRSLIESGYSE